MNTTEQKIINWARELIGEPVEVVKEEYGDQSQVFRLNTFRDKYFIKIGSGLGKERDSLAWLSNKLPVPNVMGFTTIDNKTALLLSAIEGKNLAALCKTWPAEKLAKNLARAIKQFHLIDCKDCPFGDIKKDNVLTHGDACLPNFIFEGDKLSGYIDLGGLTVTKAEVDLSAAIWSLQHNLGPGYGKMFLEEYGIENITDGLVESLRSQYVRVK